jgi:hypothetical protein
MTASPYLAVTDPVIPIGTFLSNIFFRKRLRRSEDGRLFAVTTNANQTQVVNSIESGEFCLILPYGHGQWRSYRNLGCDKPGERHLDKDSSDIIDFNCAFVGHGQFNGNVCVFL